MQRSSEDKQSFFFAVFVQRERAILNEKHRRNTFCGRYKQPFLCHWQLATSICLLLWSRLSCKISMIGVEDRRSKIILYRGRTWNSRSTIKDQRSIISATPSYLHLRAGGYHGTDRRAISWSQEFQRHGRIREYRRNDGADNVTVHHWRDGRRRIGRPTDGHGTMRWVYGILDTVREVEKPVNRLSNTENSYELLIDDHRNTV